MRYDPAVDKGPLPFSRFKGWTVPRPIGWPSSVARTAWRTRPPYRQWRNPTFDPSMVMFAADRCPDGRRKDTVVNAERTGWFV